MPNRDSCGFYSNFNTGFRNQAGSAGCTNPIAINFDPSASQDDGSCEFAEGCTLPMALNYDPSAVYEDGSCEGDLFFPNMGGVVPSSYMEYMELYNAGIDAQAGTGFGVEVNPLVYGCSDPNAINFDPNAEADDGSCVFPDAIYYGEDFQEYQMDGAPSSDGIYIGGCLNTMAQNFNPNANYDDGSCQFEGGCTDVNANNYDPTAVFDNGSCDYSGGLGGGAGFPPPQVGSGNVGDLLDQLADAAGGPTGGASGGSSAGVMTDSGASLEKDPKGKKKKRPKQRFSGFAGRDAEGFFKGAPTSQPYIAFTGVLPCQEHGFFGCYGRGTYDECRTRCTSGPSPKRAGFKSACGCGG